MFTMWLEPPIGDFISPLTCDNFPYAGQICKYMLQKFSPVLCIVNAWDYEFVIFERELVVGH
jgi:hypothetical protein